MSLFRRIVMGVVGGKRPDPGDTVDVPALAPSEGPVYAVGDVHGCLALYREVEAQILLDAAQFKSPPTIVLLGDIVDRGPQTAAVIDHLISEPPEAARRICLMGNHEAMMLAYLAAPGANANWLHLGGQETLASYGLAVDIATLERMNDRKLLQMLAAIIPDTHVRFLRSFRPGLRVGRYLLVHAGADASAPLTAQPKRALLWGGGDRAAPGGLTLVHGHFVTSGPDRRAHSIGIDTGAYATGRLTALRLLPGQPPAVLTIPESGNFKTLTPPE